MKKRVLAFMLALIIGVSSVGLSAKRAEASSAAVTIIGGYTAKEIILAILAAMGFTLALDEIDSSMSDSEWISTNAINKIAAEQYYNARNEVLEVSPCPGVSASDAGTVTPKTYTEALNQVIADTNKTGIIDFQNNTASWCLYYSLRNTVSVLDQFSTVLPFSAIANVELTDILEAVKPALADASEYANTCVIEITSGSVRQYKIVQSNCIMYYTSQVDSKTYAVIPSFADAFVTEVSYFGNSCLIDEQTTIDVSNYFETGEMGTVMGIPMDTNNAHVFTNSEWNQWVISFWNILNSLGLSDSRYFLELPSSFSVPGLYDLKVGWKDVFFPPSEADVNDLVPGTRQYQNKLYGGSYDLDNNDIPVEDGLSMPYNKDLIDLSYEAFLERENIKARTASGTLADSRTKAGTWVYEGELDDSIAQELEQVQAKQIAKETTKSGTIAAEGVRASTEATAETKDYIADWTTLFPFCIPFDLINMLKALQSNRVAPEIEIPINLHFGNVVNYEHTFVIDFDDYSSIISIFRTLEIVGFSVGLILITRGIIKG
jgi:hypothetical protein